MRDESQSKTVLPRLSENELSSSFWVSPCRCKVSIAHALLFQVLVIHRYKPFRDAQVRAKRGDTTVGVLAV